MNHEITPAELKTKLDNGEDILLLDVREPEEFTIVNLKGYLIPLGELPERINELDPQKHIVVYCHHGIRSGHALNFLQHNGFDKVQNMRGGIDLWAREVNNNIPRY